MEQKINELLQKCIANGLNFNYSDNNGLIEVLHFAGEEPKILFKSEGWTEDWEYEEPMDVINRLHAEVDAYLEGKRDD